MYKILIILMFIPLSNFGQNPIKITPSNYKADSLINLYFEIIEAQILHKYKIYEDPSKNAQFFEVIGDSITLNIYFHDAVSLIEKITLIPSPVFETYSPVYIPTLETLEKWREKIRIIKTLIVWDNDNRINRQDFDIYSGKINFILLPKEIK